MEYTAEEERISYLANKIKEIRERCFFVCGPTPCDCPKEVKRMRQEIEAMGYLVIGEATINPETSEPKIKIRIFKPKDNLPSDLAKIYDDWLMARRLEFNESNPPKSDNKPQTDEEFLKEARIKAI